MSTVNYNEKELILLVSTYGTFAFMHENIYHLICSMITIVVYINAGQLWKLLCNIHYPQCTQTAFLCTKKELSFST